jgi:uncharacterized protein YpmB
MAKIHHLIIAVLAAAFFLFVSSSQSYAAQAPAAAKKVEMGDETDLILTKRKVDPIRAGKRAIRVLVNYNAKNFIYSLLPYPLIS